MSLFPFQNQYFSCAIYQEMPGERKELKKLRKHIKPLENEYNLIQEKIDKIGEFKFKVRGWLITILSAIFVGLATSQIPLAFTPFVFILLFVFHFQEREQLELQNSLSSRILLIEMAMGVLSGIKEQSEERQLKYAKAVLTKVQSYPRIGIEMRRGSTIPFKMFLRRMFDPIANKVYYLLYSLSLIFCVVVFLFTTGKTKNTEKKSSTKNVQIIVNQLDSTSIHE
jgi:hypothetical protein